MLSLFPSEDPKSAPRAAGRPDAADPFATSTGATSADARSLVLLNPSAGTLAKTGPDAVVKSLKSALPDAELKLLDPGAIIRTARGSAHDPSVDRIIVGGGDGTVNAVAHELLGTGKQVGILPLGTLNYLARELGMPADPAEAAKALATAEPEAMTVGQVNGRTFTLFAEIGMYGQIVRHRDVQRKATGRSKYIAMFVSLWRTLRRRPLWRFTIEQDGQPPVRRTTPLLYVGVSDFHMESIGLPPEVKRNRSNLSLLVAKPVSRFGFVVLLLRSVTRTLKMGRDLEWITGDRFTLRSKRRTLRVAIDGEVLEMNAPLTVELVRDGLVVLRPRAGAAKS